MQHPPERDRGNAEQDQFGKTGLRHDAVPVKRDQRPVHQIERVGNEPEPDGDPLPRYLHSLDQLLLLLPADTLVLPSHGKPFTGLHARIAQQHRHHRERLAEVLAACATPQTAATIVPVLFKRELDLHQTTFALGESLAHLHALWYDGALARRDVDGVFQFQAA